MRRRWRVAGDLVVSGVVVLLALPSEPAPVHVVLTIAVAAVLLGRRSRPVVVAGVVLALTVATVAYGGTATGLAGPLVAVYTVAARRDTRSSLLTAGAAALVAVVPATRESAEPVDVLTVAGTALGLVAGAWALGALVRSRQQTLAALQARAELVERDRDLTVALAVERERARIMRDMHDVVGHSLSVIAVQADAARAVLDREPTASAAAMDRVGALAREALSEVRSVIRASREDPEPDARSGRDATDLATLVETARSAGTAVRLQVDGDVAGLSPAQSTTAYRIVQESLTNVLRHGGAEADADVTVAVTPDALDVTIRSTVRTHDDRRRHQGTGTGIAAMRERVAMLGGTLRAGWVTETAFEVSASVPRRPRAVA